MKYSSRILILVLGLAFACGTSAASQYNKFFFSIDEQVETSFYNAEIDNDLEKLVDNPFNSFSLFCCTSFFPVFYRPISLKSLIQQARAPPQFV